MLNKLDVLNGAVSVQEIIDYGKAVIRETAHINNVSLSDLQVDRFLSMLLFDTFAYQVEKNFDVYYCAIQSPPSEEDLEENDDDKDEDDDDEDDEIEDKCLQTLVTV